MQMTNNKCLEDLNSRISPRSSNYLKLFRTERMKRDEYVWDLQLFDGLIKSSRSYISGTAEIVLTNGYTIYYKSMSPYLDFTGYSFREYKIYE